MVPTPLSLQPKEARGYQLVHDDDTDDHYGLPSTPVEPVPYGSSRSFPRFSLRTTIISLTSAVLVIVAFNLVLSPGSSRHHSSDECDCPRPTTTVPQYFQTTPELWAGPTATGAPAFLAQTRTFDPTATFVPNQPLQTAVPVDGMGSANESIFQMMGYLSPYMPSPGFGVDEYPVPAGAEIVQLQMLSRHGARYPTSGTGNNVMQFGLRIADAKQKGRSGNTGGGFNAAGPLSFLNEWDYKLGHEILVPKGRQELFDSGILHSYMYSSLYNPNSKIIVRTTTQDRMLKSAEYFMAGFFGLEWTNNATIEVIIEAAGFNNSLAGSKACPNTAKESGAQAVAEWTKVYLQEATTRLGAMVQGYEWTVQDTYAAQSMCPYETIAYGFSRFCELFTYEEWKGFSYSVDLYFSYDSGWQSKTARAVGIGYQQEVIARLRNHTLGYSGSQVNTTLDGNAETFPLNQSLYLDFSHDTNIISILAAFGLTSTRDDTPLSSTHYPGKHNFTVSHLTPFAARLDIEIIRAPKPVRADRAGSGYAQDDAAAGETKYIHFVLNQRTLPLGWSFPECDASRVDGWCELDTFLQVQDKMPGLANFQETCYGDFDALPIVV
ncbi:3-phytase A precursor [Coniella lustricola]|uniref:3-phytase n=1 Tax=Coniella lustricola TaxID=2025994 RepID=A0A2T3AMK8_9PEZI|nr:3-phytase A precursor [Coniella lustricola]